MEWSPKETYLITCEKFNKVTEEDNLLLWDAKTGDKVASFQWKNTAKDGPKVMVFDSEERFCARQFGLNIIEVYESGNFKEAKMQIKSKLPPLPKIDGKVQEDNRVDNSKFDGFIFCPVPPELKDS